MALVIVLSLIVVLTIILVSFVTQARFDVSASSSFSQAVSADGLAQDALNSVISSLQYEMEQGSNVAITNNVASFDPQTPLDVLPKLDASIPAGSTMASLPNLIRTSSVGAIYAGSPKNSLASAVKTDQPSLDGRRIGNERWNAPMFLPSGTSAPVPNWIYVTRRGPAALGATTTETMSKSFSGTTVNPDFVIGRYAYRIYDTSGLLDVNVAGYPGTNPPAVERVGRKGGLVWADLSGAILPGLADGQILPNWRWPLNEFANYVDGAGTYLNKGGTRAGFLTTPAGANRFFGRQDFLEYLRSTGTGADAGILAPQVTTFSREVNAPSWKPERAPLQTPAGINVSIPSVRVNAAFTRRDASTAKPGEPLVNSRFPLSKIALLRDPVANAGEILAYFGLVANSDGSWAYDRGTISDVAFPDNTRRERLKTLSEVAAENREPNFFELLQAGIMADSLGQASNDLSTPIRSPSNVNSTTESVVGFRNFPTSINIARHVFQIGANIIDQYDTDDDPTVIARTPLTMLVGRNVDSDIIGIENLPYLQAVAVSAWRILNNPVRTDADGFKIYPRVTGFYQFQLWNPHRNASNSPHAMRIVAQGSVNLEIDRLDNVIIDAGPGRMLSPIESSPDFDSISFTSGAQFQTPHLLKAGEVVVSDPQDTYTETSDYGGQANIAGFRIDEELADYDTYRLKPTPDGTSYMERFGAVAADSAKVNFRRETMDNTVFFQLQKRDSQNRWMPVQTFAISANNNNNDYPLAEALLPNGARTAVNQNGAGSIKFHQGTAVPPYLRRSFLLADPRTSRFSSSPYALSSEIADQELPENTAYRVGGWPASLGNSGVPSSPSNAASPATIGKYYNNSTGSTFYYTDRGGANGWIRLADPGVRSSSAPINPCLGAGAAARPVILNRPFTNVAEMAYAFRDLPWKSLNFSQDLSSLPSGSASLPGSADSGLLDLFAVVEEPPLRAGVVNLNSASKEVIKALLLGASPLTPLPTDPPSSTLPGAIQTEAKVSASEAETAAQAIYEVLGSGKRQKTASNLIVQTPADISKLVQEISINRSDLAGWPKAKKEAIAQSLAGAHNGRTWNLAIDIIAQTGKFPPISGRSLDKFQVTGEQRLLVLLAIDRYTGEVVDQFIEAVTQE